jgi:hypothetical protein
MHHHLIFLPLMVVIFEIKIKIIIKVRSGPGQSVRGLAHPWYRPIRRGSQQPREAAELRHA